MYIVCDYNEDVHCGQFTIGIHMHCSIMAHRLVHVVLPRLSTVMHHCIKHQWLADTDEGRAKPKHKKGLTNHIMCVRIKEKSERLSA